MKRWLVVLLLFPATGWAQKNMVMYNMRNVPQSIYLNPALTPTSRLSVSMPLLGNTYLALGRSDFELAGAFSENSAGESEFDVPKFVESLDDENFLSTDIRADVLHIGFASGQNYFHFNVSERFHMELQFPREAAIFLREVYESNYFTLGTNVVRIEDIKVTEHHLREYGFGWARSINEKWTVGAKAKMLYGVSSIETRSSTAFVDPRYDPSNPEDDIEAYLEYDVRTSGVNDYGEGNYDNLLYANNNWRFAFDLGGHYKVNDVVEVSASVLDLMGGMTWKNNVRNFKNEGDSVVINPFETTQAFAARALDTTGAANPYDQFIQALEDFADSIAQNITDTNTTESYRTSLPTQLNLAVTFNLTSRSQLTVLNQNFIGDNSQTFVKLLLQTRVKRFLNATVSYALIDEEESPLNLGVGLAANAGFFQIYLASENVLFPLTPEQSLHPTFLVGINFTFNRDYE